MDTEMLSLKLTPAEIKNKEFKKTVLGYNPEEVVQFLDATAKLWERIQKREKELHEKIKSLEEEIRSWESREQDLERIREKAHADASRIREEAQEQGKKILQEVEEQSKKIQEQTESWLASVLIEVEEIERRKANFVTAFRSALDSHYEILKTEESKTEPLAAKLGEYLRGHRASTSNSLLS